MHHLRLLSTSILTLAFNIIAASGQQNVLADSISRLPQAISAIETLQQWYNESSGLWETAGWWNSANALTTLADFTAIDSTLDNITQHVFQNTFNQAQKIRLNTVKVMTLRGVETYSYPHSPPRSLAPTAKGFINDYYDDEGWWALAWLKVYDITQQPQYLETAVDIFEDMKLGWTAPCGGMWWDKRQTYTGAIENELFLSVAAQLANRATNKNYYLNWALKQWKWFQGSGMINPQHNINNGLNLKTCENDNGTVWSYNQGVILGGLLELDMAAPNRSYVSMAEMIASAAIKNMVDINGILHDPCEPNCGADGSQFKGIFMRNLRALHKLSPNHHFETFIEQNADSIWNNDRGLHGQLGLIWSGPYGGSDASTQSSACDALVAAADIG